MKRKFQKLIPFLILALLVLSLSGCNGSSSSYNVNSDTTTDDTTTEDDTTTSGGSATVTTETDSDGRVITKIVLSTSSTSSVNVAANSIKNYDCVWNITSNKGEYWTYNGNTYDDEQDVQDAMGIDDSGVYIAHDVRYVPNTLNFSGTASKATDDNEQCKVAYYSESLAGSSNYILAAIPTDRSEYLSNMVHSASDAYNNPVLHITKPGYYKLSGTWNGQIWVDIPDGSVTSGVDTEDDSNAQVVLILDSLTAKCTVASALVFKNVYQCASDIGTSSEVSALMANDKYSIGAKLSDGTKDYAGAIILLSAGSTNTLTGTNVARMNKLKINEDDGYTTSNVGQYVKAQKKLYKLDAALHSRQSIVIGNDNTTDGTLNITSTNYEGFGSELHMLIDSGKVNITAADDGINVNEDYVSVFTQTGGTLTITSTYGDGIDSNGYVALKNCTLNITAGTSAVGSAGEAGIDAESGVYGVDNSGNATNGSNVKYTYNASSNSGGGAPTDGGTPPENGNGEAPSGNPPALQGQQQ